MDSVRTDYRVLVLSATDRFETFLAPILSAQGMTTVTAANNLREAKRLAAYDTYDLIFVNSPLSDGNGYAASSVAAGTAYDHSADPAPSHDDPSWSITASKSPLAGGSFTSFYVDPGPGPGPGPTPIPEPTSGLLMLLGVAGLALRRRRA